MICKVAHYGETLVVGQEVDLEFPVRISRDMPDLSSGDVSDTNSTQAHKSLYRYSLSVLMRGK